MIQRNFLELSFIMFSGNLEVMLFRDFIKKKSFKMWKQYFFGNNCLEENVVRNIQNPEYYINFSNKADNLILCYENKKVCE